MGPLAPFYHRAIVTISLQSVGVTTTPSPFCCVHFLTFSHAECNFIQYISCITATRILIPFWGMIGMQTEVRLGSGLLYQTHIPRRVRVLGVR
jgi:hypothetical protein